MLLNDSKKRGFMALIGGAEDKKQEKTVLRRVVEVSQAKTVAIVPTASFYPREVFANYYDAFKNIGVENVEFFDIRYQDEADRNEYLKKIEETDLIYFSGGDQVKLVRTLENTKLLKRIFELFEEGKLHIAGTSAGAAAASNPMIYDGDYDGFSKDSVNFSPGFGFLKGITIDTHFVSRGRIARLSQFLLTEKSPKGIGIGEDTGIIIDWQNRFEVVGSGVVTVLNADKVTHSNYAEIASGDFYSVNNLRVGFLASGSYFSLRRWSVLKSKSERKIPIDGAANLR